MDLLKIIKDLREIRVFTEKTMMTDQMKFNIKHSDKNIIDLDDSEFYESHESSDRADSI